MIINRSMFMVICLVMVALVAGCASDPKPANTESSGTDSAPTVTPVTLSEEEQAVADAEAAYREWNRVSDACMEDPPNTYSSCFDKVSIGDQLDSDYVSLSMAQQDGTRSVGESRIVSIVLVSVDLTNRVDRPADPEQGISEVRTVPKVVFDVCTDLTAIDLIDAAGESQVPSDFPKYRRTLAEVVNYGYPSPTQWRVWNAYKDAKSPTCEP